MDDYFGESVDLEFDPVGGAFSLPQEESSLSPDDFTAAVLRGSQSLIETGSSTGLGEEVDLDVLAGSKNQTMVYDGATLEDLMANIQNEIPKVREARLKQIAAANQGFEMTASQTLAAAILQIAPVLIGAAMSGKQGAAMGAEAGALGLNAFYKGTKEKSEKQGKKAEAEAALLGEKEKSLTQQAFQLQRDKFNQEGRLQAAREGKSSINIDTPDPTLRKDFTASKSIERGLSDLLNYLDTNFTSELKDGENTGDVLLRKIAGGVTLDKKDPEYEKLRLLNTKIDRVVSLATEALNTGAPSDKDTARIKNAITSGEFATISALRNAVADSLNIQSGLTQDLLDFGKASGTDITGFESRSLPTSITQGPAAAVAQMQTEKYPVYVQGKSGLVALSPMTKDEISEALLSGVELFNSKGTLLSLGGK